ncbi:Hypothetical protein PHPALM_14349 [Phytophthora palmivora]|uniref:Uncharacterized protein n=1 Tax=Phytophthora palmivora TaxID=4796 RepID=A0A2P4XV02_9STRA|nr:Hypothetical protein PHPALM_14349 [Phytophthora palmivora]
MNGLRHHQMILQRGPDASIRLGRLFIPGLGERVSVFKKTIVVIYKRQADDGEPGYRCNDTRIKKREGVFGHKRKAKLKRA